MTRLPGVAPTVALALVFAWTPCSTQASPQDDSLMTVIEGSSSPVERAEALLQYASSRERLRPGECLAHARMALQLAQQAGDLPTMHRALVQIRDLQHRYGAHDEYLKVAIQAMELSEKLEDARLMADDLHWLSLAYERMGDMDDAVMASRKAFILLSTLNDRTARGRGMLHLLRSLVKAGRYREAIVHGDEALRTVIGPTDTLDRARVWTLRAEALLATGKAGDALPLLISAATAFDRPGAGSDLMNACTALARAYHVMGDPQRARHYIDLSMGLCGGLGHRVELPILLALSSRIHEQAGDLAPALDDERRREALEDSIMDERMAERMAGLQELYRTGKLDRELAAMRSRNETNENLIAEARVHGRLWLIAVSLLVVLLGGTFWVLMARRRSLRRIRLKNTVIRQQAEQIHATNLELERQNRRLAEALMGEEEKGALLKEIHHRVKNNLQMVNSLLRMQCDHLEDPGMNDLMRDAQGRVRAMAMVHENLYRRGDLARIDLRTHLAELCDAVISSSGHKERITVSVTSQVEMVPVDIMLPLSLLVNELLTNSIKHAFKPNDRGAIRIMLNRTDDGGCELFYHDDGVGMDPAMLRYGNFGMSLIRAFVEQLDGGMRMVPGNGTTILIGFDLADRYVRKAG